MSKQNYTAEVYSNARRGKKSTLPSVWRVLLLISRMIYDLGSYALLFVVVFVGVWLLLTSLDVFVLHLDYMSFKPWPLFVWIIVAAGMIWYTVRVLLDLCEMYGKSYIFIKSKQARYIPSATKLARWLSLGCPGIIIVALGLLWNGLVLTRAIFTFFNIAATILIVLWGIVVLLCRRKVRIELQETNRLIREGN